MRPRRTMAEARSPTTPAHDDDDTTMPHSFWSSMVTIPRLTSRSGSNHPLVSTSNFTLRRLLVRIMIPVLLVLLLTFWAWPSTAAAVSNDELAELIRDLKGTDDRIMRWDATKHTAKRQQGGACEKLDQVAADFIVQAKTQKDDTHWRLACEYATWCITDNPYQRARFSEQEGIHEAVVKVVSSGSPSASAAASHLIYIATFANERNHQGFFHAGAVQAVADVITSSLSKTKKESQPLAVQLMWAMAALQNMEASYCATHDDGRCYWDWDGKHDHVTMDKSSLPMLSDGSPVRQLAMKIPNLVTTLQHYACQGPVPGAASDGNILPGENAVAGKDDDNPAIIPWAATAALKNMALEKEAKPLIEEGVAFKCYCLIKDSHDWLEGTYASAEMQAWLVSLLL